MKREKHFCLKTSVIFLSMVLFVALSSSAFSNTQYRYAIKQSTDIYFGHISYIDNEKSRPIVFKEDQMGPEYGILNFPVAPGNTIRTDNDGRCEVQLDTGTILRLEENTQVKIETILAQTLSSRRKLTNFILEKGRVYVMYKSYMIQELFQIMTPNAAVNTDQNSVTAIKLNEDGSTDIKVLQGRAFVLYGPDEDNLREEKIKEGQMVRVTKEHRLDYLEETQSSDFELWNKKINKDFEELHEGMSELPRPVYRYPDAVIYFAEKYSTTYGEWLWDDYYGYVWRPFHYRYYPGGWQPYNYGQWTAVNGQMFWVPQEIWGWAPYHLGVWIWHEKKGWLWIPGSVFCPAWVYWDYYIYGGMLTGYFSWRPWTVLDWGDWSFMYDSWKPNKEGTGGDLSNVSMQNLSRKSDSRFVLTGHLRKVFKNVLKAAKKAEGDVLSSYFHTKESTSFVKHEWITSPNIQNKIIGLDEFSRDEGEALSQLSQKELNTKIVDAYKAIKSPDTESNPINRESGAHKENSLTKTAAGLHVKGADASGKEAFQMRFRDWNPDIKAAREMGVSIIYSGSRNEISCPELRLSSGNVHISPMSKIGSGSRFYSAVGGGGGKSGSGVASRSRARSSDKSGSAKSTSGSRSSGKK
jgi:hypothetical protein